MLKAHLSVAELSCFWRMFIWVEKLTQINQMASIKCSGRVFPWKCVTTQETVPATGRLLKWALTGKSELKAFPGGNLLLRKFSLVCSKIHLETAGAGFSLL